METDRELVWDAPGPGSWEGDRTYKLRSLTRPMQELFAPGFEAGFADVGARYGLPIETILTRFVNGYGYSQVRPVGAPPPRGSGPAKPPPPLVLKVVSRLHPELRRRSRRATEAFEQRRWRADADRWRSETMPRRVAENRRLQAVDQRGLDDAALASHITDCAALAASGFRHHFGMVGQALAVGDLLATAAGWGIDPDRVVALLAGSSPVSSDGRDRLSRIATHVGDGPVESLDDLRATSEVAAKELDDYLEVYGCRLVAASDLDGPTLGELPAVVLRAVLAERQRRATLASTADTSHAEAEAEVRAAVPAGERERFDSLLADARDAYSVREEEAGICASWPMGLLRLALLAAGERLADRGAVADREDVFDLAPAETAALLRGDGGPPPEEVAARRRLRATADRVVPPAHLGAPPGPPPPADVFPAAMARLVRAMGAFRMRMSAGRGLAPLHGAGVGREPYRGTACVADTAEEALARLEPGQVLITSITTPAFNAVLPLAGALVTQEGGLLSHPAIAARELDVPAVIGAAGVLAIPDGAEVVVDPVAGLVSVEVRP